MLNSCSLLTSVCLTFFPQIYCLSLTISQAHMALLKIWAIITYFPFVKILCSFMLEFEGIPFLLKCILKIKLARE